MIRLPDPQRRRATAAYEHADRLTRQVPAAAYDEMDRMRRERPAEWPDWCLVPMAAAVAVAGGMNAGALAALYAWRYTRSVYMIEPSLYRRVTQQVPDALSLEQMIDLPEWCVYIPDASPAGDEWPGAGLWAHLEHDVNTGRPELRLLLDRGVNDWRELEPVLVYLDRDTLTEAVADMRATALATLDGALGPNVRGGTLDADAATVADRLDPLIALVAYLARPEADITAAYRNADHPARSSRRVRDRQVWAVGYTVDQ